LPTGVRIADVGVKLAKSKDNHGVSVTQVPAPELKFAAA
jgi:hypothetical protein